MFSNLTPAAASASSSLNDTADPVAFVIVGIIVVVLFLGIVIRILRRNRLKK